jgi:hypothetical protein
MAGGGGGGAGPSGGPIAAGAAQPTWRRPCGPGFGGQWSAHPPGRRPRSWPPCWGPGSGSGTCVRSPRSWRWPSAWPPAALPPVLAVGSDMAVGKMSACLELRLQPGGGLVDGRFVGTGQAGILISGAGVCPSMPCGWTMPPVPWSGPCCEAGQAGPEVLLLVEGQGSSATRAPPPPCR